MAAVRTYPEDTAIRQLSTHAGHGHKAAPTAAPRSSIDTLFTRLRWHWNLRAGSIRSSAEHGFVARAVRSWASRNPVSVRLHHPFTRILHWATFALLIVAAGTVCAREYIEDYATNQLLLAIHECSGLMVLALIVLRLAWRACAGVGQLHATAPRRGRIFAALGHYALYTTTLTLPILGWLTSNAYNQRLRLFGLLPLPTLIARDRELGYALQDRHVDAAWLLLALVLGHVACALWHHYVRRDDVLRSMQPYGRRRRRKREVRFIPGLEPIGNRPAA